MGSPAILIAILALIGSVSCADDLVIRGEVSEFENGSSIVWTPQNFAGFYYDIDRGLGAESLQLKTSEKSVSIGDATYASSTQEASFEHGDWGHYRVLAFLGEIYFAGYGDDCIIAPSWSSLNYGGVLNAILIDNDSRQTISEDEDLLLEEGYRLRFSDSEAGVKVSLYEGNAIMDTTTVNPPETYVYSVPMGDRNVTLIAIHVAGNVKLKASSYYTIKGKFQISEDLLEIEPGMDYGGMEISSIGEGGLVMTNVQEIDLSQDIDVDLIEGIRLKTADSADQPNRVYVYRNITEPGTYEIRGSMAEVIDGTAFQWDAANFPGFYYDMDENLGGETITMTTIGDALDEPDGVVYETIAQEKMIEYGDWGEYWNIGFMGQNYFAGYVPRSSHLSPASGTNLLVDEQLSEVLMDSAEPLVIEDGDFLELEEGFAVKVFVDNSCEMVFLELYKDNFFVRNDYFRVPDTYVYATDFGDSQDVAVLAIHVADLDCAGGRTCLIDGVWQISTHPISVEEDTEYDKMTIQTVNVDEHSIMMNNEDKRTHLSKNRDLSLMGDIRMRTSNQATINADEPLRFYIYTEETVES